MHIHTPSMYCKKKNEITAKKRSENNNNKLKICSFFAPSQTHPANIISFHCISTCSFFENVLLLFLFKFIIINTIHKPTFAPVYLLDASKCFKLFDEKTENMCTVFCVIPFSSFRVFRFVCRFACVVYFDFGFFLFIYYFFLSLAFSLCLTLLLTQSVCYLSNWAK